MPSASPCSLEEGMESPGTRVIDSYESPSGF